MIGYRVWLPKEKQIIQSRDVVFNENKIFYADKNKVLDVTSSPSNIQMEEIPTKSNEDYEEKLSDNET